MTANPFAALLDGVPRINTWSGRPVMFEDDVLAALAAVPDDLAEAGKVLEGVTPGPWRVDGEPWNQIVWSGADNRVCFMAHSNGLDDDRDVATARFIAWCREGVPALIALAAAQAARIEGLEAGSAWYEQLNRNNSHRAEAAERALAAERAKVAKLVEAGDDWDALMSDARAEAEKAMRKFPRPNYVISKIAEEAGEVVKAAIHAAEGRETVENLRGEMKQLIAMLYRLWIEGDQVHALGSVSLALLTKEAQRAEGGDG